ncbi:MAG TPA: MoaD/ThiS family protein [Caulobacteraceae bacterium]|nr:MoaD/ThiS family protein [Caulobacteraceae bacterium]
MPHVVFADSGCRVFTGGVGEVDVAAKTVGAMIDALEARFPGLGAHIERRMAVAIDGEIHQDARDATLREASEVYLIPRIGGG